MKKLSLKLLFLPLFALSCLTLGCDYLKQLQPTDPAPVATTQPTTQPTGQVTRDEFALLVGKVNAIATTAATVIPPGNPVHTGAVGVAAISGLLLSANELIKKLFGKKSPDNP